jgi:glycosyltransferase involved in cell wall biosynthesis
MPNSAPSPRRRLTMVITELDIGGAEQAFVRIATGLKPLGWDICVISLRDAGPLAKPLLEAGISVTALNVGGFTDLRAVWRLKSALKVQRPDVLVTFLHQANIAGRIAGRWAGVPRIICGVRVADRRWSVAWPERLTRHLTDHYVAVSKSVADVHQQLCRIAPECISTIPNGVDFAAIQQVRPLDRSLLNCQPTDRILLCVGRLTEQKAPLDVFKAFEQIVSTDPVRYQSLRLLFVGDGPLRGEMERRVRLSRFRSAVQILGWRSDVLNVMKSSDVLVLASRWEGLPNVILEAQAAGLPVIASDIDGCLELVDDKGTGRIFQSGNTNELSQVLTEVLENPQQTQELARAAKAHVAACYSWTTCVSSFHQLLLPPR